MMPLLAADPTDTIWGCFILLKGLLSGGHNPTQTPSTLEILSKHEKNYEPSLKTQHVIDVQAYLTSTSLIILSIPDRIAGVSTE